MSANKPRRNLWRALALRGHPKVPTVRIWLFLMPQLVVYLYLLGPVFVYFVRGVPPEESLEVITGTWRVEGNLRVNRNGLVAPKYFVDTEQGAREVHCGFPMQRQFCELGFGPAPWRGHRVTVKYDSYFGVLAFQNLDEPMSNNESANMAYAKGVYLFAQKKDTIYRNYHAHWMLFWLLVIYAVLVAFCLWGDIPAEEVAHHGS